MSTGLVSSFSLPKELAERCSEDDLEDILGTWAVEMLTIFLRKMQGRFDQIVDRVQILVGLADKNLMFMWTLINPSRDLSLVSALINQSYNDFLKAYQRNGIEPYLGAYRRDGWREKLGIRAK